MHFSGPNYPKISYFSVRLHVVFCVYSVCIICKKFGENAFLFSLAENFSQRVRWRIQLPRLLDYQNGYHSFAFPLPPPVQRLLIVILPQRCGRPLYFSF